MSRLYCETKIEKLYLNEMINFLDHLRRNK